ncbi:hypothetical protein QBC37DRAFT_409443 [Rhypophila decipiens]|uniref:DNA polymerase n=1 Tax=Rhypophila decipiens TaxID=261697 RepID=A0AAN6YKB4_9PEZI|nr:hypothetical protein QBC37DRAFT_409443 [Rhypophila decipiens]
MAPDLDFPVIFLLSAHLGSEEMQELEEEIPTLTYDINEAQVILGKVSRKERALFELRKHKFFIEEVAPGSNNEGTIPAAATAAAGPTSPKRKRTAGTSPSSQSKRRKIAQPAEGVFEMYHSDTTSDTESHVSYTQETQTASGSAASGHIFKVVKLSWFTDSIKAGEVLPLEKYLLIEGRKINTETTTITTTVTEMKPPPLPTASSIYNSATAVSKAEAILKRALQDAPAGGSGRPYPGKFSHNTHHHHRTAHIPVRPALLKKSTSEEEVDRNLPPIPAYLHTTFSCQRPTPVNPPNDAFIEELKKIRTARTLTGDKIGVRAYSSAIATLAAYPYKLSSAHEVSRLPGCGSKIALLFQEWRDNNGRIAEAVEDETDPRLAVLKLFYEIWGVGETTARDFYNRGWRDLDDIVEYGWDSLTRVQQIGVKYYDEFLMGIPRDEVERIANKCLEHANRIVKGFQMVIVGGYRRGKKISGDVDLVLSHPDEKATLGFVEKIVLSLEAEGYITHTLILSTKNSERGQMPVAWKGNSRGKDEAGTGFDTLDKALVVWQDPEFEGSQEERGKRKKNPNPHRRVDIIISPWKTAGCAVLGWTSGTTFQRDLRRYCKKERQLKFDSSGVRSRVDGQCVDLESDEKGRPAPDMLTAERRVFQGLGLEWRDPEERVTG